jgi:hypothetical protein
MSGVVLVVEVDVEPLSLLSPLTDLRRARGRRKGDVALLERAEDSACSPKPCNSSLVTVDAKSYSCTLNEYTAVFK